MTSAHRCYCQFLLGITILYLPLHALALTQQDEIRVSERAQRARQTVARYETMVASIDRQIVDALAEEKDAKFAFDRSQGEQGAVGVHESELAESQLNFSSDKSRRLFEKRDRLLAKLEDAKEKSSTANWMEKKVKSQRRYERYKKRFANAKERLADYIDRVAELEDQERLTRAESAAKARLATISRSGWDRKMNNWQAQTLGKKADALVGELKYFRDKIVATKAELVELEPLFKAAELDYAQYAGSAP